MTRPRRSLLFMPGSNARALEKARTLAADGIILDLEDSVAPDAKAVAREQIAKAVAAKGFGKREVLIRINALDTPWWVDDIGMAGKAQPDGILVPKISTVDDLNAVADRLTEAAATPRLVSGGEVRDPPHLQRDIPRQERPAVASRLEDLRRRRARRPQEAWQLRASQVQSTAAV